MRLQLRQAWVDDLKIHDVDDPAMLYSLRAASRKVPQRVQSYERAMRHGTVDLTQFYGAQVIDLAGYAWGATDLAAEDAYDALRGKLVLPGPHTFRFRRLGRAEDEQVVFKTQAGPDAPQEGFGRTVKWSATLVSEDPRVYSATLKSGSYDPTASLSGGGVPMPMPMPLTFTTTTATELFVTNEGQFETPPTFTVTGPAQAGFAIDNDTTGKSIYVNQVLGQADVLVVDVGARTVRLNGALRPDLYLVATSTWFPLTPGQNALRLRGSGFVSGQTTLTVQFRDARI